MEAPILPWTDAQVADAAEIIRSQPHGAGRILHRIAAAYGMHAYRRAQSIKPATLHLNGCDGAEVWTSPHHAFTADPVAGLSSFLRAVEAARPA